MPGKDQSNGLYKPTRPPTYQDLKSKGKPDKKKKSGKNDDKKSAKTGRKSSKNETDDDLTTLQHGDLSSEFDNQNFQNPGFSPQSQFIGGMPNNQSRLGQPNYPNLLSNFYGTNNDETIRYNIELLGGLQPTVPSKPFFLKTRYGKIFGPE